MVCVATGKRPHARAALAPYGDARLRAKRWMPTLRAAGKLPKVALIAAMRELLGVIYSVADDEPCWFVRGKIVEIARGMRSERTHSLDSATIFDTPHRAGERSLHED